MSKENNLVLYFSLLIIVLLLVLIFQAYNSKCNMSERFENNDVPATFKSVYKGVEQPSVAEISNQQRNINDISSGIGELAPSDPMGDSMWNDVPSSGADVDNMQSCFPRDSLTSKDLLPVDAADSKFANVAPSTGGSIMDGALLNAGMHVGVNSTSGSLRNANLQLRSEPANPSVVPGPWNLSTITSDTNRKVLEIGSQQYEY